ncbi:MAG: flagellar motor protein [Candidatus Firestonebacteria bacterium]|nr:flagellar motor protein [Candidatus Firestonebacteria bacterium]
MDLATIGGLILAWVSLGLIVFIEGGGNFQALVNPGAFILVVGGTLGATMVGLSLEDVMAIPSVLKKAFLAKRVQVGETITMLVNLSRTVRKEGLLSLESVIETIEDDFFKKAIQIVVDGMDADQVRAILETDLELLEERHKRGHKVFATMGGFGPTLGIIGTVMGLVFMLANLSTPDTMGPAISAAFIATLYGVSSANLLYLPIAAKLQRRGEEETLLRRIILEGILSIQAGDNPRILEEKLLAFLPPRLRLQVSESLKGAAKK